MPRTARPKLSIRDTAGVPASRAASQAARRSGSAGSASVAGSGLPRSAYQRESLTVSFASHVSVCQGLMTTRVKVPSG